MAATDAMPMPRKGVAYRVGFPIFDADGDLVSSAADLDSEVSKDGAGFADCTNEATEIGSSGMYYLDLSSTEMNADMVIVIVKTSTAGAKTTPIVLYPAEAGDFDEIADDVWDEVVTAGHNTKNSAAKFIRQGGGGTQITIVSGTLAAAGTATATLDSNAIATAGIYISNLLVISGGTGAGQTRRIVNYTAARVATVDRDWIVTPNATSTYDIVAAPTSFLADEGVVVSADATHVQLATTAPDGDDTLNSALVNITSGTGSGQTRLITDYVGATRTAQVAAWGVTPDTSSTYAVIPAAEIAADSGGGATAPTATEVALATNAVVSPTIRGADNDTLKTISDEIDDLPGAGTSNIGWYNGT